MTTPKEERRDERHDEVPGGSTPADTPGATGPTTRDTERAVAPDANEDAIKRVELGGDSRTPYEQGER
jgi:hypothetical protein